MQVMPPPIVGGVTPPALGLPYTDVPLAHLSGKSTEEVLAEHLNSVRSALLRQASVKTRSPGALSIRSRSRSEIASVSRVRRRSQSAQSFLFASNANRSPEQSESIGVESGDSTIHESATNSLPVVIGEPLETEAAAGSGSNIALPQKSTTLHSMRHTQGSARNPVRDRFDFKLLYEPLSPQFELAPVNLQRNSQDPSTSEPVENEVQENKANFTACKSLVGQFRDPQNRELSSDYDRLFGNLRANLFSARTTTTTAPSVRMLSARDFTQPQSKMSFYENEERGTYFVLNKNGFSERRVLQASTRVQIGRNGRPILADGQLADMLGASALLSGESVTLQQAFDALKLAEKNSAPKKLSWKEELSDPDGTVFDLRVLDQRKQAMKAKAEAEMARSEAETARCNVHLDLRATPQLSGSSQVAPYRLGKKLLDRRTLTKPPEKIVGLGIRKQLGDARLGRPLQSKTQDGRPLTGIGERSATGSNRPLTCETGGRPKPHRIWQPLVETLPLPALNMTAEQWRTFAQRPGPVNDEPLHQTNRLLESGKRRADSATQRINEPDSRFVSIPSCREVTLPHDPMRITPFVNDLVPVNSRVPTGHRTRTPLKSAASSVSRPKSSFSFVAAGPTTSAATAASVASNEYLNIVQGYGIAASPFARTRPPTTSTVTRPKEKVMQKETKRVAERVTKRVTERETKRVTQAVMQKPIQTDKTDVKMILKPSSELAQMVAAVAHVVIPQPGPASVLTDTTRTSTHPAPTRLDLDLGADMDMSLKARSDAILNADVERVHSSYTPAPPASTRSDDGMEEALVGAQQSLLLPTQTHALVNDLAAANDEVDYGRVKFARDSQGIAERARNGREAQEPIRTDSHHPNGAAGVVRIDLSIPLADYDRELEALNPADQFEN